MNAEIETFLVPHVKKVEFFKDKNIKDYNILDIANSLKYEYHSKDYVVCEMGKRDLQKIYAEQV